jgi:hypothetical protein
MWVFFFLKNLNFVSYTTSELYPDKFTLSYKKFINYLNSICPHLKEFSLLEDSLTSFKPIKLVIKTGVWEELPITSNITNDELFKYHYKNIVVSTKDSDKSEEVNPYANFKLDKVFKNDMDTYFLNIKSKLDNRK